MSGSEVGLAITSTIMMTSIFAWVIRESAVLEGHMISVERVIEYSQLPSEENGALSSISGAARRTFLTRSLVQTCVSLSDGSQMNAEWPMGDILFDDVSLCYSDDRFVLKNINCRIKAKEKASSSEGLFTQKNPFLFIKFSYTKKKFKKSEKSKKNPRIFLRI